MQLRCPASKKTPCSHLNQPNTYHLDWTWLRRGIGLCYHLTQSKTFQACGCHPSVLYLNVTSDPMSASWTTVVSTTWLVNADWNKHVLPESMQFGQPSFGSFTLYCLAGRPTPTPFKLSSHHSSNYLSSRPSPQRAL